MSRDVRLSIKISEEKHQELKAMAESYGVTMSALSALILGQWLHQQNQVIKPMVDSMGEILSGVLKEHMEGDGLDR